MLLNIQLLSSGAIQLQSDNIQTFINNQGLYNKIKLTCTISCCDNLVYTEQDTVPPSGSTVHFVITDNAIVVTPIFFNAPLGIKDGVYLFEVKLFKPDGTYTYEKNCAFIDITYKCRVAETLKNLLDKYEPGEIATNAHILHYALVNGSNCGCNCNEMCEIFNELTKLLYHGQYTDNNHQSLGCGCN